MSIRLLVNIGILVICIQLLGCGQATVSFSADVQPIFQRSCIECHTKTGEGVAASGFSLDDYASTMKGTNFGPVVIPGSSISSTLYLVVALKTAPEIHMPPHHAEALAEGRGSALSKAEIEIIAAWIDQGAQDN
jgi:hypothetical protein